MNEGSAGPNPPPRVEEKIAVKKMDKDEMIKFLWMLLDDIDSAGDMFKADDKAYRKYVVRKQRQRFETGITTDGYTLTIPQEKQ